ncbi:MAG: HEPN domain-containing protein [Bacteroides sp.]|nr:HEPN domain-containing protein [Bacteroides sp.]
MNDRTKYWVEIADYDMETARAMFDTGRYLYVGFMCHQVVEKMLKAYWTTVLETPPLKIHTLLRLVEESGLDKEMTAEQAKFIDQLEPLNIETRYPSYKEQLHKTLTPTVCRELIQTTTDFQQWIKSRL